MTFGRAVRLSVRALTANRARTGLVVATIALGVAAVLAAGALGTGAEQEVARTVATIGSNLLVVRPAQVPRLVSQRGVGGPSSTLRLVDAEAIATLPEVAAAAPGVDGAVRVKAGRIAAPASVMGTTAAFLAIRAYRLDAGRFIDPDDERAARRVVVLGARVAGALFPEGSAVDREVRVRGVPFVVVGTLAPRGASIGGGDEDDQVVMPVTTALRRVFNRAWISAVFVRATRPDATDRAAARVAGLLRLRHRSMRTGADDFEVQDTAKVIALQRQTLALLRRLTAALAAITFAAGGAGVLALMWLSVGERTTEIGLRRAVGATPGHIVGQFLGEAALLATAGWLAGAALGVLVTTAGRWATNWSPALSVDTVLLSIALIGGTVLGPGLVPALRAARVPPIRALRGA